MKTLYEVEIKSLQLLREGKRGFITYFKGGKHKTIISNLRKLYPQFMNPDDKPVVNITKITEEEYNRRLGGEQIVQKQHSITGKGDFLKLEDYETLGN